MKSPSIAAMLTRVNKMMADLKHKQSQGDDGVRVVLYDVGTGQALPGYEPAQDGVTIWIPDNGRDRYKDGYIG